MRPRGPRHEERPEEVDVEHPPELIRGERFEQPRIVDTGVVHHDIDATERIQSGLDDRCCLVALRNRRVARHGLSTARADLVDDVVGGPV